MCIRDRAKADASAIDAKSRVEAADIYSKAYSRDRELYTLLRSLDTLSSVVHANTTLVQMCIRDRTRPT